MPVRKKKKRHANRQKMEKAQHLKQFISEVQELIAKAAGPDIVRCIPESEIVRQYKFRIHPVRVRTAPGETIPQEILQFSNHIVTLLFKNMQIPIGVGALTELSLYHFFSTAYTVITYAQGLPDDAYTNAATVKKALAPLAAVFDSPAQDMAVDRYHHIMLVLGMWCSNFTEYLYTFKFSPHIMARGISKAGLFSEIYRTRLPRAKILIGENHRPAWQVGWYLPEPEPHLMRISIRSEDIHQPPGNSLDVYIQSHALNRLSERLDGIDVGILHYNIFSSFNSPKVCRNKTGLLLFEYALFGEKAGYFLGELADGKIVLKTFLFLTHKGTPEADKLQTIAGLMKEDIIYLDIDKLSTFIFSDITVNERVKQLFIDAGCGSLFKIDKELCFSSEGMSTTSKAGLIEKYLQLNTFPKRAPFINGGGVK
jgi:hypothetical protein